VTDLANLPAHEAGHVLAATILGYQAGAYVLPHRGKYFIRGKIANPIHRAAVGLAGALGELMIDHPRATREEAQRFVIESGRVSTTDWEMIGNEMYSSFHGLWLAVDILREHHPALVKIANLLAKFGEVNFLEVQAACHIFQ
jgi:hypothetical protein